jgi:CRP-like cAMP-binding protein
MRNELIPTLKPAISEKTGTLEDPFAYLRWSSIRKYGKRQAIYTHGQRSTGIYLVLEGKVKVLRPSSAARVVVDVYRSDEFFGESALVGHAYHTEEAVAIERTEIMSWSRKQIEDNAAVCPKLAIALLQVMVCRSLELADRIESFSVESPERRLVRTLVRFAERFGKVHEDGIVTINSLTHELLSQYIGTPRDIVSRLMGQFQREGYVECSRGLIALRERALTEWHIGRADRVAEIVGGLTDQLTQKPVTACLASACFPH